VRVTGLRAKGSLKESNENKGPERGLIARERMKGRERIKGHRVN
jgi:hypothetical protein